MPRLMGIRAHSPRSSVRGCERLTRATRLETCLKVSARFGGDRDAARHLVALCADHFQVHRTRVAALVQHADVAQQIDVTAPVRLHLRRAWVLLPSLAVADVDVADALYDGADRFDRILTRPPDVAGVH